MKILTCSNSCPQWADGQLNPRSAGGLVPMLNALLAEHGGDWIFTAPPGGDLPESVTLDGGITLHPMGLDEDLRRRHYDTVSIQLLLGLLHYMHDTSVEPVFDRELGEAWAGYETVNRLYAERLTGLSADTADELILINDPHLMLVPEFFTAGKKQRKSKLTYFLGTPWCEPDYFTVLPGPVRTRILESSSPATPSASTPSAGRTRSPPAARGSCPTPSSRATPSRTGATSRGWCPSRSRWTWT